MKLKCIIIDDEPNAVNLLEVLIEQVADWQIVAKCYNGLEALQAIKSNTADFIFLDINMPHLNGLELAALLPKETKIIFTTAYSEHAAESYTFSTLDYLLKPITLKRFLLAQQKIETHFSNFNQTISPSKEISGNSYYFVKAGKSLHKILLNEILYFEGGKEYVQLVTTTEKLLVYRRLKEVEEQLSYPYIRVHNSFIVNIERIDKYQDNHIVIGEKRIPVSDKYRVKFTVYLNNRIF